MYILGCGGPGYSPIGFGSSYVLRSGDEYLMFDCGPATTQKLGNAGLTTEQVDYLFFTHHHSDHDLDYPCFLLTRWFYEVGQLKELQVYGPEYTELLTTRLIDPDVGAFAHDFRVRMNHPMSLAVYQNAGGVLPRDGPTVMAKDIGPGKVCEGKDWEVVSARAEHVEPWLDSLAYRFNSSKGSIVFTGDTRPCRGVAELAKGTDVLVINCVGFEAEIEAWHGNEYMIGTTATGKLAQEAGAKKLVLVHHGFTAEHGRMERAIVDISKEYDGEIILGQELMELEL